ncbi:hypothetical protein K402DRAFT_418151 [Aulographum hederae CBS 113979]|uniref:Uncharacterized protein n=1 Tax=Aulographum hederae CBS 113979 TaxID=1176131 RepID=A0A6G1HAH6_9PEZI|nr:hypothetical protein K402DRAFT_418151 [Aulographum hederae CBS 113979]
MSGNHILASKALGIIIIPGGRRVLLSAATRTEAWTHTDEHAQAIKEPLEKAVRENPHLVASWACKIRLKLVWRKVWFEGTDDDDNDVAMALDDAESQEKPVHFPVKKEVAAAVAAIPLAKIYEKDDVETPSPAFQT